MVLLPLVMDHRSPANRLLDGFDRILGGKSALKSDPSVSLDNLRSRQGEGLGAVSASMSRIARPILAQTLKEVREAKRKLPEKAGK